MAPRELFLNTYSGTYKGKTATVPDSSLKVTFPDLSKELRPVDHKEEGDR
jgi:hypothetical protein